MKISLSIIFVLAYAVTVNPANAQLPNAKEIAPLMYPGWNLGNTLEACPCTWLSNDLDWETGWQSTKTTQAIIDYVRDQGFKSVRIPVAWYTGHLSSQNLVTIKPEWMARVKQVVDYCINDGLYVILNDHWDGGWLEEHIYPYDAGRANILRTLWTQIATEFKDYDEHLLFAGLNEPNADSQLKTDALIQYEQDFVNAVRATGGNNLYRTLVIQGPSTNIDHTSNYYTQLPTDTEPDRLMMEVHYYSPYNFCMMTKDESWGRQAYFWGTNNHVPSGSTYSAWNSTWGEEDYLEDQMGKMFDKYGSNGVPVIIGEYGAIWRTIDSSVQDKHNASIKLFHKLVNKQAIDHGCVPFVWDTNGLGTNSMDVLNRKNLSIFNSHAILGIFEGVAEAKWPASMSSIEVINNDSSIFDAGCYNLEGQPVSYTDKGFLICNGKVISHQ